MRFKSNVTFHFVLAVTLGLIVLGGCAKKKVTTLKEPTPVEEPEPYVEPEPVFGMCGAEEKIGQE